MSIIRVSDHPRRFGATWARLRGLNITARTTKSIEDSRERSAIHPGTRADHGSDRRAPGLRAQQGSLEGYIVFEVLIRVRLRFGLRGGCGRLELIVDHFGI